MAIPTAADLTQPNEPASPRVDAIQEEVMTVISPDGRPPEPAKARSEWKWLFLIGIPLGLICIGIMLVKLGLAAGLLATALLLGYVALTVPVWGAGLLRGKEERIAREVAQSHVVSTRPE